ncbi:ATP-binding protein [Candidatus Berkelbacteria bacterium]|nr:ATP-binding protein [Candidatus Berkelbacteria bacterium]
MAASTSPTRLIILGGFAGTGKTTIARKISAEFNIPLLSSDDFIAGLQGPLGKDFHSTAPIAYDVLFHILYRHLSNGVTAILDANMCHQRTWDEVDKLLKKVPDTVCISIVLDAPLEVIKERVDFRGKNDPEHVNLGGDSLEDVLHKYDFIRAFDRPGLIRIDSNQRTDAVYAAVLSAVGNLSLRT